MLISQGFGKRQLEHKQRKSVKQRKLGGKAAQEFQLLSDRNESKEEHFPSSSANAVPDPLPNTVRVRINSEAASKSQIQLCQIWHSRQNNEMNVVYNFITETM